MIRDASARLPAQHGPLLVYGRLMPSADRRREAALCRALGIDLVVTGHHECIGRAAGRLRRCRPAQAGRD